MNGQISQYDEKMLRALRLAFFEIASRDDTMDIHKLMEEAWKRHQWREEDTWSALKHLEKEGYIRIERMPKAIWGWKTGHYNIGTVYQ